MPTVRNKEVNAAGQSSLLSDVSCTSRQWQAPNELFRKHVALPTTESTKIRSYICRKPVTGVLALASVSRARHCNRILSHTSTTGFRSVLASSATTRTKEKDCIPKRGVSAASALLFPTTYNHVKFTTSADGLSSLPTPSSTVPIKGKDSKSRKPVSVGNSKSSFSSVFSPGPSQTPSSTESFRSLSIFPTAADLKMKADIRPNKVSGGYDSVEDYLDVQFRLLREDVFAPLREGVEQYLKHVQLSLPVDQLKDVEVYTGVFLIGAAASRWGVTYKMRFDASNKREKLTQSKRLIFGSQVVLSADNFDTIYVATVQDSSSESTAEGELDVSFEPESARRLADTGLYSAEFVMVETTAYFEAYRHVLEGIKEIKPAQLPFQDYIVRCNQSRNDHPRYLKGDSTYDLSCIVPPAQQDRFGLKHVPVLRTSSWPSATQLGLDQSQYEALQLALTREFAIIQGPPGTGKTFIGLKIVNTLLANRRKTSLEDMMSSMRISPSSQETSSPSASSPILVVCYTNHALDQFLERILEFSPEGVIRIGNRSSSQKLEKCALSKHRPRVISSDNREAFNDIMRNMINQEHATMADTHRTTLSDRAIFKCSVLEKYMHRNHARQIRMLNERSHVPSHDLVDWLDLAQFCELQSTAMNGSAMSSTDMEAFGERKFELQQRLIDAYDDCNIKVRASHKKKLDFIEENETSVNFHSFIKESKGLKRTLREDIHRFVSKPANSRRLLSKLRTSKPLTDEEEGRISDVKRLDLDMRWRLYATWVFRLRKALIANIITICRDYDKLAQQLKNIKAEGDVQVLQNAKVIGMTTTGAARMRRVLKRIKPQIIVVEEAAEVLEAHVVVTLCSGCQHVILIGDHQQLRPNPTVQELARTYKLDVSLFERMVNNNIPFKTLSVQHRMKPEFSAIMKNHFYSQLQDSPTVRTREKVRGMEQDMFYLAHSEMEEKDENQSYYNLHEAKLVIAMCWYLLLRQGYCAKSITVLSPYNGQIELIRKRMFSAGADIHLSSIDGYQGEQNDIVLLSIVRSNDASKLGFVNIPNRICVALSRAKLGFYVFGNFKMLARCSEFWRGILVDIQNKRMLARDLALVCNRHGTRTLVRSGEDFDQIPRDGGCPKACNAHTLVKSSAMPTHTVKSHVEMERTKARAKTSRRRARARAHKVVDEAFTVRSTDQKNESTI